MPRLASFVVALALAGCAAQVEHAPATSNAGGAPKSARRDDDGFVADGADVASIVSRDGRFSTFAEAIEETRMAHILRTRGPFVVPAPIDEAFRGVPPEDLAPFVESRARRATIVRHHAVLARGD